MRRLPLHRLGYLATVAIVAAATLGTAAACGGDDDASGAVDAGKPVTLRLGYFPNITHAPAIVGVEKGIFAEKLGSDVKLETKTFNAGPAAIEAIFSGAIDATYIGPNPAINALRRKSKGEAIRIVSGAASGGVALVVKPEHHLGRGPQGQEDRHPAARQHPGRGAALLAQGEGPDAPPRRAAATSASSRRRTRRPLETFAQRRDRRRLGAGAVRLPARQRRRQGAGRRARPVAGQASSSSPT